MVRIPRNRAPVHPGKILQKEYLEPLGMSRAKLADWVGVPVKWIDEIIAEKWVMTEDSARLLAGAFSTSPRFWLNLQQRWNLYHAMHSELDI